MHGNNIRVCGVPESTEAPDMTTLVRSIFNQILNCPKDNPIEIDRAHRALWPKNKDPTRHRDIICCLHYYTVKESIMKAARDSYERFSHTSPCRLVQVDTSIAWGPPPAFGSTEGYRYPIAGAFQFQRTAHKDGKSASFKGLGDLSYFLGTFQLPQVRLQVASSPLSTQDTTKGDLEKGLTEAFPPC